MTNTEYAASKGLTMAQLTIKRMAFLQSEGYDDNGNEYETLDAWLDRTPTCATLDPIDGGRGAGMYGLEDF